MLSNINCIKCLIVEDDPFKMEGIRTHLDDIFAGRIDVVECQALNSATLLVSSNNFDLAILDMSIHSHELEAGTGSPFSLSSGGLDVLFELDHKEPKTPCIILTQYPDIEIEGIPIPIEFSQQEILNKFDIQVAGCVRYVENDSTWKSEVKLILERL